MFMTDRVYRVIQLQEYKLHIGVRQTDLGSFYFRKIIDSNNNELNLLPDEYDWLLRALASLEKMDWRTSFKEIEFTPKYNCCQNEHEIKVKITKDWNVFIIPENVRQELILDIVPPPQFLGDSVKKYGHVDKRRQSFGNWKADFISPENLSRAGFYYTGIADNVRCFACNGLLYSWKVGDDPLQQHRKHFSKCFFVNDAKSYDDLAKEVTLEEVCYGSNGKFIFHGEKRLH
ncbi:baculoviral IAP repeat-containing protein 1-like isoform X1 [Leptotrombidium deliense]|uniref:Baculoviral IAP repeat-containing protein 1-like isoform X1 n=1 Tax=Leptotrombidium deliense TaxID=299467 RepID=A0A443S437_9ACAR|nr:baculoviral IAP repeat-containing protein 1-like isoform X1 [Leptotrombidium deliense]